MASGLAVIRFVALIYLSFCWFQCILYAYMFGILENYHCWRFHGSDVMQGFEIVRQILLGTSMHLGQALRLENAEMWPCTWCVLPRRDSPPLKRCLTLRTDIRLQKASYIFQSYAYYLQISFLCWTSNFLSWSAAKSQIIFLALRLYLWMSGHRDQIMAQAVSSTLFHCLLAFLENIWPQKNSPQSDYDST